MTRAQGILGTNLIVNGNAEAGPAGAAPANITASIPGWTVTGKPNVIPYNLTGLALLSDPAPPDHGFQYFVGGSESSVSALTQDIDISSAASIIAGGNVKYSASAYLGSILTGSGMAEMLITFKNANGQTFSSATLGPVRYPFPNTGMFLQQQIGLVPAGAARITVKLTLNNTASAADSLSLVLSTLKTSPGSVLGTNLVVNGNAESGPGAPHDSTALYVPGWSTLGGASVAPYGGAGWIQVSDPGPADRGVNVFCGRLIGLAEMYQDIDISAAAGLIDSGQVTYEISAWLGGLFNGSANITYAFFDWSGTQLAPTSQLIPTFHSSTALVETSHSDRLPPGARRVHISLSLGRVDFLADDIAFVLAAPGGPPVIAPGGIVSASAFGGFSSIAPGTWIEIFGANLASGARGWSGGDFNNGVAPTSLDGVSVSVDGAAAFVDYISPGQINALVPSNAPTGVVKIIVSNSNGASDGFALISNQTEPGLLAPDAFKVGGKRYVAALFPDGQTFAIPQGAISGVASHPAKAGDTVIIYGVGFGPVTGGFTAGTLVDQQNSVTTPLQFFFGSTPAALTYSGLVPSFTGLYQFNVVVPKVPANNATPISISLGGVKGIQSLVIAVEN